MMNSEHPVWSFLRDDYTLWAKVGNIKIFMKDGGYWQIDGDDEPRLSTKIAADTYRKQQEACPEPIMEIDFVKKHGTMIAKFERSGQFPDNEYEVYEYYDPTPEPRMTWWLIIDDRHIHHLNEADKDAWCGFALAAGAREWRC